MGGLECSGLQRKFWNVLGKGWVGWNEKLRTERVMSIEEGEMAFPERECDVGWDGQTGPDSWARTWTCRGVRSSGERLPTWRWENLGAKRQTLEERGHLLGS